MKNQEIEEKPSIVFDDLDLTKQLFGEQNTNLKVIEDYFGVRINVRGNSVRVNGSQKKVELASKFLDDMYYLLTKNYPLHIDDIEQALRIIDGDQSVNIKDIFLDIIFVSSKQRRISPKSLTQKIYIEAIRKYDIVFSIGPAGTGKTYLAMAMAVSSLIKKEVDRIILTRPAVEAGEKLGFLPGDMFEKVNPYLRPLYDALHDMMDLEKSSNLLARGIIEVAPLAFMRGRTLNDSFVVLDEAQNTTSEQMKMFLTRLGFNSKAVITGDITQVDLPEQKVSGLIEVQSILKGIEGLKFIYFSERDVVRHRLVQDIIKAYERHERAEG